MTSDCSRVHATCRGSGDPERPGLVKRAVNFAKAAAGHIAAGRPKADEAEIARRFAICEGCELFKRLDAERGYCTHGKCGCNVTANVEDFLNKAAWLDQACPHPAGNKWEQA